MKEKHQDELRRIVDKLAMQFFKAHPEKLASMS